MRRGAGADRRRERVAWTGLARHLTSLDAQGFGGESVGSNSWAVAGTRTRSGRAMLANDPHLGLRSPAVFYLARIETPDFSVTGATLPGIPGVVIGRNGPDRVGSDGARAGRQDLFEETARSGKPGRDTCGRADRCPSRRRDGDIRVRGGEPDAHLEIRTTRCTGPVVTGVLAGRSGSAGRSPCAGRASTPTTAGGSVSRAGLRAGLARRSSRPPPSSIVRP